MSLDSRFPNLFHVKDAPNLGPTLTAKAVAFVNAIVRRVPGVKGCFNATTGELFFYFIDPSGGPLCVPITGDEPWPLDQRDEDDCVAVLRLALEPFAARDRRIAAKEAEDKKAVEQAKGQKQAERRPELQAHAAFLRRKRRGLQTTSVFVERPSGLVVPHEQGVPK